MKRIAVCWPSFGPYHRARLNSIAAVAAERFDVVGIETLPEDNTYAWKSETLMAPVAWQHRSVTPDLGLKACLDSAQPQVVCVNGWGFSDSRQILMWAWRRSIPIVLFSDSRASDSRRSWVKELIKKMIVRRCRAALVAGPEHADYLVSLGMSPSVIFQGLDVVDNAHFANGASEARSVGGALVEPHFLYVGRFVEKKNVDGLLRAYSQYRNGLQREDESPWHLCLVGSGPEELRLKELANELGLGDFVKYLPFQQYDQLPTTYASASCVVVPSRHSEQWALVVNESMAAGVPVIVSSACGCVRSLLANGQNGLVFNAACDDELADSLLKMHRMSPSDRNAMAQRASAVIASWGLERFAKGLCQAIDSIETGNSLGQQGMPC